MLTTRESQLVTSTLVLLGVVVLLGLIWFLAPSQAQRENSHIVSLQQQVAKYQEGKLRLDNDIAQAKTDLAGVSDKLQQCSNQRDSMAVAHSANLNLLQEQHTVAVMNQAQQHQSAMRTQQAESEKQIENWKNQYQELANYKSKVADFFSDLNK